MQIEIPPNYGKRYNQMFRQIYPDLSQKHQIPLLPFFLVEIIEQDNLMMKDGLHPTANAQPIIAKFMAKHLQPHLK